MFTSLYCIDEDEKVIKQSKGNTDPPDYYFFLNHKFLKNQ
jgi:hypothetical protein